MLAPSLMRSKVLSPGSRIRVLVVDDSVVIRRLVTHALAGDDQIEVVAAAPNGLIALERIRQLNPDVLTLDIEMPEMDGLETLRRIREFDCRLPVIMFSTLTERGAAVTLQALSLGASDYVTKAANAGSLENSTAALRSELVPKIKQFFQIPTAVDPAPLKALASQPPAIVSAPALALQPRVVVIGVSTGGPNALAVLMPQFPRDFPLPILVVQHMPALFTRMLADRLDAISAIRVEEVSDGARLENGKALIATGGYHMRLRKLQSSVVAATDQEAPENSCRPAVDVLFRSAAEIYGGAVIGVILTGMGNDGLRGAATLKQAGAYVIAQDEASSVIWGMPGAVVKSGLADSIVDLHCVVPEILKRL